MMRVTIKYNCIRDVFVNGNSCYCFCLIFFLFSFFDGLLVSHSFGYGLMDAAAMVQLARVWNTVTPQQFCEIRAPDSNKYVIHLSSLLFSSPLSISLSLSLSSCFTKRK